VRAFRAVGVFADLPITCPYLAPAVPAPPPECLEALGWQGQADALHEGIRRAQDIAERVKGYAGRLVTDPLFRRQRDELRRRWLSVAAHQLPGLPLSRAMPCVPAGAAAAAFQTAFDDFCDRYGLLGMTTWDLPDPAGPLLDGLAKAPHLLAGRPVLLALPAHFSLLQRDDLHGLVEDLQGRHLRDAGLDPGCKGPRSVESYGQLLVIEHYQRVVLDRYGGRPRPKGLIRRLHEILAAYLDLGPEHFRTLHRQLTRLLRATPRPR
jgi:hypothetical protein